MPKTSHVSREQEKLEKAAFKAEKQAVKAETAALVLESPIKAGVHNCPEKDAGTTHSFRARCLKLQHAGFCPACGGLRSYKHGCREHEIKDDNLLEKAPTEEEMMEYHVANGLEIEESPKVEEEAEEPKKKKKGKKGKKN